MLKLIILLIITTLQLTKTDEDNICLWNIVNDGTAATQYTSNNGVYEYKGEYRNFAFYLNNDTSCGSAQSDGVYIYYKLQRWYIGTDPRLVTDAYSVEGLIGGCNTTISPTSPESFVFFCCII